MLFGVPLPMLPSSESASGLTWSYWTSSLNASYCTYTLVGKTALS